MFPTMPRPWLRLMSTSTTSPFSISATRVSKGSTLTMSCSVTEGSRGSDDPAALLEHGHTGVGVLDAADVRDAALRQGVGRAQRRDALVPGDLEHVHQDVVDARGLLHRALAVVA